MSEVNLGSLTVTQRMYLRSDAGRFVAAAEAGARAAAFELAESVAAMAKVFAPRKTGRLAGSIRAFMTGTASAAAIADAPYAAPQEKGAVPHAIGRAGQLLANREEQFIARGPVTHPGNRAVRYLERAGVAVAAVSPTVIRKHMPGM